MALLPAFISTFMQALTTVFKKISFSIGFWDAASIMTTSKRIQDGTIAPIETKDHNNCDMIESSGGQHSSGGLNDSVNISIATFAKSAQDFHSNTLIRNGALTPSNEHFDMSLAGTGGTHGSGGPNDPVNTSTATTFKSTQNLLHNNVTTPKDDPVSVIDAGTGGTHRSGGVSDVVEGTGGTHGSGGPNDPVNTSVPAIFKSAQTLFQGTAVIRNGAVTPIDEHFDIIPNGTGGTHGSGGPNKPVNISSTTMSKFAQSLHNSAIIRNGAITPNETTKDFDNGHVSLIDVGTGGSHGSGGVSDIIEGTGGTHGSGGVSDVVNGIGGTHGSGGVSDVVDRN